MPLTASSPTRFHTLQNISIILLSAIFAPLCTLVAILSHIISPFTKTSRHIERHRQWRKISSSTFRPRTVLVTGIGTDKGLMLARAFYRAGHCVIGADFEPYYIPVAGHFSKSMEDAEAAEVIERETKCRAIQFSPSLTSTLQEELSFIKHTRNLGLNVPNTHIITSEMEVLRILYPSPPDLSSTKPQAQDEQYTIKPVNPDDPNTTLLPLPSFQETQSHIRHLNPAPSHPFILQQFTPGQEYLTHSLILQGTLKAFVACPSPSSHITHFAPLYSTSALSLAMQTYTSEYARKTGLTITGHLSLTFLIADAIANNEESHFGVSATEIQHLMTKIYAISCSPRVHASTILLSDSSEDLAEIYLSLLPGHEPPGIANGHRDPQQIVVPSPAIEGYYFLGYDVLNLVCMPFLKVLKWETGIRTMVQCWLLFAGHVLFWREAMWEFWDPWPWWFTYVVYWPLMFGVRLWEGKGSGEVSTGEMTSAK
ncbi:uncharacterized protein BP5553_09344 [Venustampulla echinocandica]|uniref:Uncharacterized protein n=1 Tax=Venustampulla echinocandica TaxID=2656787 RepID=A0A370TCH4_9HELO|nr:uncharacterized protein BP5553_09344 [Venustampulla echinocandica]RDL31942.1 hypothetical protein BP5553_09344 [Venustampulla echinocandica]